MSTVNKGLLGVLILQVVILLGMTLGGGSDRLALSEAVALFPGLEPEKVTAIEIYGPSKDGEGQESVKLARKGDGWVIAGADDFPAKKDEVKSLISTLAGLRSRNQVLTGSTYHEKLEVAEDAYRRKIVLTTGGEKMTAFLGTSPSFKNIHVRKAGDDAVYQASNLSESDAGARAWNWVDRTYVKIPKEQVWAVTLKNEHGTLQLERDPNGDNWAVLGVKKELDKFKVEGIVNDARDIGLEAPVGKAEKDEYGLGEAATVTLVTGTSTIAGAPPETTETVTVRIGKKLDGKDRRYVKASTSEYVVESAGWEVNKLVDAKREDLIKEEEKKDDEQDKGGKKGSKKKKS